jgi:CBS domain-containing protein
MPSTLNKAIHSLLGTIRSRVRRAEGERPGPGKAGSRASAQVRGVMTRNPRTSGLDDTLHHAAQIMWDTDCGSVPVVDGDGRLVAMLTDRDICMAAYTQGQALWQILVSTAASRDIVSVHEGDTLETAHDRMRQHQVRRLTVIDPEGRPIGIVSLGDLARRGGIDRRRGGRAARDVAATLAAVCRPSRRASAAAE